MIIKEIEIDMHAFHIERWQSFEGDLVSTVENFPQIRKKSTEKYQS